MAALCGKVLRSLRNAFEYGRDELPTTLVLQIRIADPLFAQRRYRLVAQVRSAQGTGTVSRQDHHFVGQLGQLLRPRIEHHGGQCGRGHPLAHQIRASHAADEQRVAGQHCQRFVRLQLVGHQPAHAVRRVPRRFEKLDDRLAESERVAFLQFDLLVACIRLLRNANRHSQLPGELNVSGNEVRMRMRQPDTDYLYLLLVGDLQVAEDVASRIDHQALITTDHHVGKVGQDGKVKLNDLEPFEFVRVDDLIDSRVVAVSCGLGIAQSAPPPCRA